jgi:hypothetical protein
MKLKDRLVIGSLFAAAQAIAGCMGWGFASNRLEVVGIAALISALIIVPAFWDAVANRIRKDEAHDRN